MTPFGPTRAEIKFRLFISFLGLLFIALAVAWRGVPTESQVSTFLLIAFAFLLASAWVSGVKLRRLDDD